MFDFFEFEFCSLFGICYLVLGIWSWLRGRTPNYVKAPNFVKALCLINFVGQDVRPLLPELFKQLYP
jgi:hypothetical protein